MSEELTTTAEERALDTIKLVPAPKARALGFSDKIFDMLDEKESIADLGEYIKEMKRLTMSTDEGKRMFEFLYSQIINPRLAKVQTPPPAETLTTEAAASLITELMNRRREVSETVDAHFEVSETVAAKARELDARAE